MIESIFMHMLINSFINSTINEENCRDNITSIVFHRAININLSNKVKSIF